jgi:glycosidase
MARVECRRLAKNFHALKSAGWSDTCGGSRIKNRLTKNQLGLVRLDGIIPRFICASLLILFAATLSLAHPKSDVPSVTKVEPPSWWTNHRINPVRLLIRGENLNGARVKADRPQTVVSNVRVNSNGTYLFVDVRINSSAPPGDYPLTIETAQGRAMVPFRLNALLVASKNFQGITSDDVIYLIMTDRFSDGDPSNNAPADAPPEANDRRNPRAYHGGDLRGIINHLQYFKDLGVTALWLTPWYDNWNGVSNCDKPWCPNTSYHGYGAIDYYGVEDHFGDLATLQELIQKAHAIGLKVIQDQVANHVGAHHPWMINPPLDDWFHGTARNHMQDKFQNSTLLSPHANRDEVRNTLDGWFSDDLPDMNQEEPEVARYEIQNSLWWVGVTGIDGIRQDTIQYMPRTFIRDLSNALHRQYSKMWMVGEVFERDSAQTAFFIGGHNGWDGIDTKLDSDFDFPLWYTSLDVFTGKKPMRALRDQLKYDALYPDPSKATTLTNNHDTPRFMSIDGATLEGAMLHTAFMLTVRGTPQLYSGEEIAMEGKDDPDNRRDFPGGFPGDSRSAFLESERTPQEQRMWQWTHDWLRLRREHSALRKGRLVDLFYDDDAYAYARVDSKETVIIAINRSASEKRITISAGAIGPRDGANLVALYGSKNCGTVAKGGTSLIVPARMAAACKVG